MSNGPAVAMATIAVVKLCHCKGTEGLLDMLCLCMNLKLAVCAHNASKVITTPKDAMNSFIEGGNRKTLTVLHTVNERVAIQPRACSNCMKECEGRCVSSKYILLGVLQRVLPSPPYFLSPLSYHPWNSCIIKYACIADAWWGWCRAGWGCGITWICTVLQDYYVNALVCSYPPASLFGCDPRHLE